MDPASVDWAAVVRVSPIAAAIVSPRGEWLEVNPALTALIGYPREELFARTLGSITYPDDVDRDLSQLRAVLSGEIASSSCARSRRRRERRSGSPSGRRAR